eukprot:841725-Rhodomonas_salina.1
MQKRQQTKDLPLHSAWPLGGDRTFYELFERTPQSPTRHFPYGHRCSRWSSWQILPQNWAAM